MKPAVPLAAAALLILAGQAAADVIVVPASTAAVYTDDDGDGFFEAGVSGPLTTVSARNFDGGPADVALLGFDTSGLLASDATINSVRFEFRVVGLTDSTPRVDVASFGYVGGLPGGPDFAALSQGGIAPVPFGPGGFDLNALANVTAGTDNFFGLRLSGPDGTNAQFAGPAFSSAADRPRLVIDFTPVPEPTAAAAALLAAGGLALRRRRAAE